MKNRADNVKWWKTCNHHRTHLLLKTEEVKLGGTSEVFNPLSCLKQDHRL